MFLSLLPAVLVLPSPVEAANAATRPALHGVPVDFVLFGLTLLGVALFRHRTLQVAVTGLASITVFKWFFSPFHSGPGLAGLLGDLRHEWVITTNLLLLIVGFAFLADHFQKSGLPLVLPRYLPDDWKGGFALLVMVFVLSTFLDNIAAALIGGAMARSVFHGRVHLGYLAAIVAASNAGGSGSVVGDTTTTMMWINHVSPLAVLHAFVASGVALVVCGVPASFQQQKYSPILKDEPTGTRIDRARVFIVGLTLVAAIVVNIAVNVGFPALSDDLPFIGLAVWAALLAPMKLRRPDWSLLPGALRTATFLLSLVLSATMMPVESLPAASWRTTFDLGFLSAVFDNIPLTAIGLEQGGYDWGMLAYAVGFGGSMIWFGSSTGVALSNMYPEAKSAGAWLRNGWHVTVAYVVGFFVLLALVGWHPTPAGLQAVATVR
jgi:Na+/H+ antiporter NhaD/arsenite permease-like protein